MCAGCVVAQGERAVGVTEAWFRETVWMWQSVESGYLEYDRLDGVAAMQMTFFST